MDRTESHDRESFGTATKAFGPSFSTTDGFGDEGYRKERQDQGLRKELDDLRKEVKGLQDSFNTLKKEHGDLQREVRARQNMHGGLPVESIMLGGRGNSKQAHSKAIGKGATDGHTADAVTVEASEKQGRSKVDEDNSFFGTILESCGFGSGAKRLTDGSEKAKPPPPPETLPPARPSPRERHNTWQGRPVPASSPGIASPKGASPTMEVGGSSSSGAAARGAAAARTGVSPHEREAPMEPRGNVAGSGRPAAGATPDTGAGVGMQQQPDSSLSGADRAKSASRDLPQFGTSREPAGSLNNTISSAGSFDGGSKQRSAAAAASGASSASESTIRSAWKSPANGGVFVPPFPDLDDDDGDSSPLSPGSKSPVPKINLPTSSSG